MSSAAKSAFVGEIHDYDPKKEILAELNGIQDEFEVLGSRVMVAIYKRPEKTAGGIIRPDETKAEDDYQGKTGLVLGMGPLAFAEDDNHHWGEKKPKIGDWVMFRVGDTFPFALGSNPKARRFRMVEDVNVHAIVKRPDIAW